MGKYLERTGKSIRLWWIIVPSRVSIEKQGPGITEHIGTLNRPFYGLG